jgi:hypothetical protein
MKGTRREDKRRTTILLKDLDPRRDVRGGAGKELFRESEDMFGRPDERDEPPVRRAKGLSPGKASH